MGRNVKIRKGVDIKLKGAAEQKVSPTSTSTVAIKPTDFPTIIPKMELKQGAEVKAGTPIFHSKVNPEVKFVSPVSGEIAEIVRGDKRRIMEVRILADTETKYETYDVSGVANMDAEGIKGLLAGSGHWTLLNQRPYDVVPDPAKSPKAIFVSAFDSAPLAPDYNFILKDRKEDLQRGIDALSKIAKVHVSTRKDAGVFGNLNNCEKHTVSGPHPAGNVGVQIHHIDPVNKGEAVWAINPQDLAALGSFLGSGKIDNQRTIALTGAEVKAPQYFQVTLGTSVESVVKGNLSDGENRVISGNVLTGTNVGDKGYLGMYDHQITVIREDHEPEFFGWISPGFSKFSLSRTFFSWLAPGKKYNLGTSLHGEERAFVMSGQYENVFPMDIYPVHMVKAMMYKDIDQLENLGVYEIAPEDFALCEFACTSKINVQDIVREGLNMVHTECG